LDGGFLDTQLRTIPELADDVDPTALLRFGGGFLQPGMLGGEQAQQLGAPEFRAIKAGSRLRMHPRRDMGVRLDPHTE
jgi:hypothetical protein